MIKKVAIIALASFTISASIGFAMDNLYKKEIDDTLNKHAQEAKINVDQAESKIVAFFLTQLEEHKNKEIQRANTEIDEFANNKIQKMNEEHRKKFEEDRQAITDYVDKKISDIKKKFGE